MCCVPESDVVAVEPQPRLDAVAVDAGWLPLFPSGVGSAIPIAWLSQAICSLVKGVAMSSRVTERTQTGTKQGLVAKHYDCWLDCWLDCWIPQATAQCLLSMPRKKQEARWLEQGLDSNRDW